MSIYTNFSRDFFEPFAELCSSSQLLTSVEGQFFSPDDPSSNPIVIKLNFDNTSFLMIAQDDDSILLKWDERFVSTSDHQIRRLDAVTPWNSAVAKPLFWAWIMINQQGYFDGLRLDFAESSETATSKIQLLVVAGEFKYNYII